jgi:hypothetical protein
MNTSAIGGGVITDPIAAVSGAGPGQNVNIVTVIMATTKMPPRITTVARVLSPIGVPPLHICEA